MAMPAIFPGGSVAGLFEAIEVEEVAEAVEIEMGCSAVQVKFCPRYPFAACSLSCVQSRVEDELTRNSFEQSLETFVRAGKDILGL